DDTRPREGALRAVLPRHPEAATDASPRRLRAKAARSLADAGAQHRAPLPAGDPVAEVRPLQIGLRAGPPPPARQSASRPTWPQTGRRAGRPGGAIPAEIPAGMPRLMGERARRGRENAAAMAHRRKRDSEAPIDASDAIPILEDEAATQPFLPDEPIALISEP